MEVKMQTIMIRNDLCSLQMALKNNRLTVGFLGGSITENRVPHNWPEVVTRYLLSLNPSLFLKIENAAIGATGSDLGLIRVREDIIDKHCDIVFLEYAVNDFYTPQQIRFDQMEGLIRRIKEESKCDIVLVYTYLQDMQKDFIQNRYPDVIKDYEKLADYYGINSAFVGKIAYDQVIQGLMRFEEWLPDGLHPQYRGSLAYGEAVIELIKKSFGTNHCPNYISKPPISPSHWQHAKSIPLDAIEIKPPFFIKRCSTQAFVKDVIYTSTIGAHLQIKYVGTALLIVFDFGKRSSEFRYRLDGGQYIDVNRDRPSWVGNSGWLRPYIIGELNRYGEHHVDIVITHGNRPECEGTNFEITHLLALQQEMDT